MANTKKSERKSEAAESKVAIYLELAGPEADRFLQYKSSEFITGNAQAARKLMLERLVQVETPKAA